MNNIGAVAILLPAVVSVAREIKISPSKLHIPLAWASLMGGNITLIGTPPNILASSILTNSPNIPNFDFFDFAPMGLIVLTTGILYMVFVGRHLLPARTPGTGLSQDYPIREYLTEVRLSPSSPLLGKKVREIDWGDLNVLHIYPSSGEQLDPRTDHHLEAGDRLLIESPAEKLVSAAQSLGLASLSVSNPEYARIPYSTLKLAEVVLAPNSNLNGRSLEQINLRARLGVSVLAIRREGSTFFSQLADTPLQFGDSLLVEGSIQHLDDLRRMPDFLMLDTYPPLLPCWSHQSPSMQPCGWARTRAHL